MYFIKRKLLRLIFRLLRKTPNSMPMVQYWKTKESVSAKVTRNKDGALVMHLEGEKETFPGFPRGHLLYGTLSKLKHEVKNKIFNDSWALLEQGKTPQEVADYVKYNALELIKPIAEACKLDMVPPSRMVAPVKELWRAWTVIENRYSGQKKQTLGMIKEILTYILQEDDAYRFRAQWLVTIFNPSAWWFKLLMRDPLRDFDRALQEIEHAEIIGDMKERMRLLRRILLTVLYDPTANDLFRQLCAEMDWNKFKLSKADKFHFRGKWFRVDLDKFSY